MSDKADSLKFDKLQVVFERIEFTAKLLRQWTESRFVDKTMFTQFCLQRHCKPGVHLIDLTLIRVINTCLHYIPYYKK